MPYRDTEDPLPLPPLLPRIAAGDRLAVGECVQRYGPLVQYLARRWLRNPADLDDALQDIFLEVWKQAKRYDAGRAAEVTFISLIARRRLIDRFRRFQARPAEEPLPSDDDAPASSCGVPCETHDEVQRVRQHLAALPQHQQQVMLLAFQDGYTHTEIVEKTGLPLGTVKTLLRRGLIDIRARLTQSNTGDQ